MKKLYIILMAVMVFCSCNEKVTNEYNLIPYPKSLTEKEGRFKFKDKQVLGVLSADSEVQKIAQDFAKQLELTSGISLNIESKQDAENAPIVFQQTEGMGDEAYKLQVNEDKITVQASKPAGFFYAVQTLYQLLPPEIVSAEKVNKSVSWLVPCVEIDDEPRFAYRGMMLDVARYFMPKEYVLEFIDRLAEQKLNRFHFHLTDDQAWRIEIKKYPKLIEIGSTRPGTQVGYRTFHAPELYDGVEHKGYYTQEDIKEIVAYAKERYITVIPEIELPGHSAAAVASYPELSCGVEEKYEVIKNFGIFKNIFCPNETTFKFLDDVFTEVAELFPSEYIHIGGDECPRDAWKKCTHCQQLIKKLKMKDEEALQNYFTNRVVDILNTKGKKAIGWDEILDENLAPNAAVMSWRGDKGGIKASKAGHNVVMVPHADTYLNYYQEDPEYAMVGSGSFLTIEKVHKYDPIPQELSKEDEKYIMGTQATLWVPYMKTPEIVDYYMYPRFYAITEVAWTPKEGRNYESFMSRIEDKYKRLDIKGINACRNYFDVYINGKYNQENKRFEVALTKLMPKAEVRYTTDNSEPTSKSDLYTEPIVIDKNTHIKVGAFVDGKLVGKINEKNFYINKATGKNYSSNARYRYRPDNPGGSDLSKFNFAGLTNGIRGYLNHTHPWVALHPEKETLITVDLEQLQPVKQVKYSVLNGYGLEAVAPEWAAIEISKDSVTFTQVAQRDFKYEIENKWQMFEHDFSFEPKECRYVRIKLKNGNLPYGIAGYAVPKEREGQLGLIFMDEIEID